MSTESKPTTLVKPAKEQLPETCLKSYPQFSTCGDCKKSGVTNVENKINPVSLITCCYCGLCWDLYRLFKFKDFNCYDATHRCNSCTKVVYEYKSC